MNPGETVFCTPWLFPWSRALASYLPAILVYHRVSARADPNGLDANTFDRQIAFLRKHFEFVSPALALAKRKPTAKPQILLTVDDGFRNQAEIVAPILRGHQIPATFFISSRHCTPGKYLWFSYLEALERYFPGNGFYCSSEFIDMSPDIRSDSIHRLRENLLSLRPHPRAMYEIIENELPCLEDFVPEKDLLENFSGMTKEQVEELAADSLFSVGVHTVDHPFLSKCSSDESRRQILNNKNWLEKVCHRRCDAIAYPSGDYNTEILLLCKDLELIQGHALIPVLRTHPLLELARVGIYSASLSMLAVKVLWGNSVRAIQTAYGLSSA